MPPRKKRTTTKKEKPQADIIQALEFIKCAQSVKANELPLKSHCRFMSNMVMAFDGNIAAGYPINEDLHGCPHTFKLSNAFKRCKDTFSITKMDQNIIIKSGSFRTVVPCINEASIPYAAPDPQVGIINDSLKEGLKALNPVISESGDRVINVSVLLRNNSLVATDSHIIFEYWHGIELPDGLTLPKQFVKAVCKINIPLVGVGVSPNSVTFHYENGAWLKTQIYQEKYPNVDRILDMGDYTLAEAIQPGLFEAIKTIASFADGDCFYTTESKVCSHASLDVGATYDLENTTPNLKLSHSRFLMLDSLIDKLDLTSNPSMIFFYGPRIRGALARYTA